MTTVPENKLNENFQKKEFQELWKSINSKYVYTVYYASEVCVYAKLPRSFQIPTPVGNYSPDWAIAFNKGTVKHLCIKLRPRGWRRRCFGVAIVAA